MRSTNWPPWRRAKAQLNSAVRAEPMCRNPVGLGAKRVRTGAMASGGYRRHGPLAICRQAPGLLLGMEG